MSKEIRPRHLFRFSPEKLEATAIEESLKQKLRVKSDLMAQTNNISTVENSVGYSFLFCG